ncbi:MAG: AraC family transcriptional regulator [Hyphomicrobium sp.]
MHTVAEPISSTEADERGKRLLSELRLMLMRQAADPFRPTPVPGLTLARSATTSSCMTVGLYAPMVCMIVQGSKQVVVGNSTLNYDTGKYLVSSVDLPISARVTDATLDNPYLAVALVLDLKVLAEVASDLPNGNEERGMHRGIAVGPRSPQLLEGFVRLLRLLESPSDVAPLAPLILREIYYRLLTGQQSALVRQIALVESRQPQVLKVIDWIRHNYAMPLRIDALARLASMSPASLHRQFKALTAMSPLQYQKQIRLQKARQIMLSESKDAASAGYAVGYGSPSQFSREYRRMFGAPPHQHMRRMRLAERE